MRKLIETIEEIRGKLDGWRKRSFNEAATRRNVIDPLIESLGWNMRDPDEVSDEYSTVDNKAVDYALQIKGKPELFIEAKALSDSLDDVKAITQVVGYAANNGVDWCVLTNGAKWKIYRTAEKCPAPEKLVLEISIDPKDSSKSVTEVTKELWILSKGEVSDGRLDIKGKQLAIDSKVKKVLDRILQDLPDRFVGLVRKDIDDKNLRLKDVRESMLRVMGIVPVVKSPEGKEKYAGGKTEPDKRNYAFWQKYLAKSREKTDLMARISPGPYDYLGTGLGISGVQLNCLLRKRSGAVEIYIDADKDTGELNKAIFDKLFAEKQNIETELGFPLEWKRLDSHRSSGVSKWYLQGGKENPDGWPALQEKMIDTMIRMDRAFRPRLKRIVDSLKK